MDVRVDLTYSFMLQNHDDIAECGAEMIAEGLKLNNCLRILNLVMIFENCIFCRG